MNPIASLALAMLAFVGTHLLMSHPLRAGLVRRLGERSFALAYSLVAFATLGWVIFSFRQVEAGTPLWVAPDWGWLLGSAAMLAASILLIGSLFGNPALPQTGAWPKAIQPPRGVFAITRHPMNTSFSLWALVHIAVWASPRNLIVAGGILLLAVAGSIGQDRKKRALRGEAWIDWEARTSFLPFAALLGGRASWRAAFPGWIALLGGATLWLLVTWFHAPAVSPAALL